MFNPNWIDRDCSREDYLKIRAVLKKVGDWGVWQREYVARADYLQERADIAATLKEFADADGYVGIVESGRDCDCVQYCHGARRKFVGAFQFEKERQDILYWADGPAYVTLCRVDELPKSYSRDLALEAYEDGHAHSVSEVRYDEEGTYYV